MRAVSVSSICVVRSVQPNTITITPGTLFYFSHLFMRCLQSPVLKPSAPALILSLLLSPRFLPGDSHCLPLAWRTVRVLRSTHVLLPLLVTGLKAWHLRPQSCFHTKAGRTHSHRHTHTHTHTLTHTHTHTLTDTIKLTHRLACTHSHPHSHSLSHFTHNHTRALGHHCSAPCHRLLPSQC